MQMVSSAENSSLDWRAQVGYIEDIDDGRGYTGGLVGFCSGTSDMLAVVNTYTPVDPFQRREQSPGVQRLPCTAFSGRKDKRGVDGLAEYQSVELRCHAYSLIAGGYARILPMFLVDRC
jgi:Glycosyl hydrolase family 46